ncbi:MAG: hypothetical protein K2I43_02655 [Alistipes sp.]|nr:hypothetical protein [Alistipes sp.]
MSLLLCAAIGGCGHGVRESNPARLLGRPMQLPRGDLHWQVQSRDTSLQMPRGMKIVVYYDAGGCTSCRMKQLESWKTIIREVERLRNVESLDVEMLFILRAKPHDRIFERALVEHDFRHPVLCDGRGDFERENVLARDELYNVFLLTESDRTVMVGSPIFSPELWERYKDRIRLFAPKIRDRTSNPKKHIHAVDIR